LEAADEKFKDAVGQLAPMILDHTTDGDAREGDGIEEVPR